MVEEEHIDPVPDMPQPAFHTLTAAGKEVVKLFSPILEVLYRSLHDFPQPAPSLIDVMLPSE